MRDECLCPECSYTRWAVNMSYSLPVGAQMYIITHLTESNRVRWIEGSLVLS